MENLFHVAEQEAREEREGFVDRNQVSESATAVASSAVDASKNKMRGKNRKIFTEELDDLFDNVKYDNGNTDENSYHTADFTDRRILNKRKGFDKMLQPTIHMSDTSIIMDDTSLLSKRRIVLVIDPKKFARLVNLAQNKGTDIKSLASVIIEKYINDFELTKA